MAVKRARTHANIISDIRQLLDELETREEGIRLNQVEGSSNIDAIGYNFTQERLRVQFKNNSVYDYADVPEAVYRSFLEAFSYGQFFNEEIKDVYAATKVQ